MCGPDSGCSFSAMFLVQKGGRNISKTRKALIFDIQRYSVHDGPGIRTLVFFKGCPLRCYWCCNPESTKRKKELALFSRNCIGCYNCVNICPEKAISVIKDIVVTDRAKCNVCGECEVVCYANARKIIGREMSVSQVFKEIRKDKPFYYRSNGGVTLSGGEPTLWPEFARDLLQECVNDRINTAIETSGYTPWENLESLVPVTGLFLFDLKNMDDKKHRKYTGVSNKLILVNLVKLSRLTDRIIIRIAVIPGFNDSEKNVAETARFVKGLKVIKEIDLLPYHRLGISKYERIGEEYKLKGLSPPPEGKIARLKDIVSSFGLRCIIEN